MRGTTSVASVGLLVVALGALAACGDDHDATPTAPLPSSPSGAAPVDWTERWAEAEVGDLLAALGQPHAVVRDALGPHRLELTADYALRPTDPPVAEADRPAPPLDAAIVTPQRIHDELALVWATTTERGPRWSLHQANDHDRGRDVVVIGETIHVRPAHREWFHYPRDSDLVELWLDDAQRSVHDAVQLAAPRLSIDVHTVDGAGLAEGAAVEITLALAPVPAPELTASGPTQGWRARAEIEAIAGALRLDATSGAWLSADVDVSYRLIGADGQPYAGRLALHGRVEPGPAAELQAPPDSQPLPDRVRYEDQQRRVLDGLAGP